MNGYLKQSTASQVRTIGPFIDDTDFKTLENALTIANTDVKIKKNGAASGNKNSGGATADGAGGLYHLTWDATDTATVGELYGCVQVSGALPVFFSYVVLEEAVYDAIFGASAVGYVTDQPVNVTKWAGTTVTTGDIAIKTTLAKTTHITGFNDLSAAQVNTEADTALSDIQLDHLIQVADPGGVVANSSFWAKLHSKSVTPAYSSYDNTTDSQEALRDNTGTAGAGMTSIPDSAGVTTLLTRIPAALFTGITSLAQWLGLMAGKQTGNSTARTEVRATGAGSGTFDETTDSQEAVRDRGDAAWLTGAGGDPWTTSLPGAYGAGTAGNIVGNNLNATVSSRATPAQVATELTTYGALKPTTPGATLDVNATGEAGVDWGNVGNKTTTNALTNTTIATVTTLTNAPPDSSGVTTLLTRIPAALFTGITSLAQWLGMLAGKQTGNSTARTEIRATGAGSGTFDEVTDSQEALRDRGDAAWVTGSAPTDPWTVALPGAYGAGTAGKIVGDNINATVSSRAVPGDAMALTSGERTTLSAAIWNVLTSTLTTASSIGKLLVDNINATISSRATQTVVDAIKVIADKLDTALELDGAVYRYTVNALEQAPTGSGGGGATVAQIWDEPIAGHLTAGSTGAKLNAAASAGDPWSTALPGAYGAGTAGKIVGDNVNATISSRATPAQVATELTTYGALKPTVAARTLDVNANGEAGLDFDNTSGTLAKGVDITGFNDLSGANVQSELTTYGALKPTVAGRALDVSAGGEAGLDWANIGTPGSTQNLSATTIATVNTLTSAPPDSAGVTTLLARIPAALFSGITSLAQWLGMLAGKQVGNTTARTEMRATGAGSGTFDEVTDSQEAIRDRGDASWITGAGGDPWLTLVPGAYGAGTAGNILGNNLNATVSSRATPAQVQTELGVYGALKPTVAARTLDVSTGGEAGLDWANIGTPASVQNLSATTIATLTNAPPDSAGVTTLLARIPAALFAGMTSLAQWLGLIAGKQAGNATARTEMRATGGGSGTYDETTDSQEATRDRGDAAWITGSAPADPWTVLVPGSYGAGSAGNILGNRLDVAVSSRLPTSSYVAPDNAGIASILAKVNTIPSNPATVADVPTAIQNADALLKRDWNGMTGEAAYSMLNAARMLRNVWSTAGSVLAVKKEDGTTTAWSRVLTTDPAAAPITGAS